MARVWGRWTADGLFFDATDPASAWVREVGRVVLPTALEGQVLEVVGRLVPAPAAWPGAPAPGLRVRLGESEARWSGRVGGFTVRLQLGTGGWSAGTALELALTGVTLGNAGAWLARVTARWPLPGVLRRLWERDRRQWPNRRLRLEAIRLDGAEVIDFRSGWIRPAVDLGARLWRPGLNVYGFFSSAFGIGEAARACVRAARAAALPVVAVPLRLPTTASAEGEEGGEEFAAGEPNQPVSVFHLDAPQADSVPTWHGEHVWRDRYNIAFWHWEVPDFPPGRVRHARFFDEVWVPSEFVRRALAPALAVPVHVVPHAVEARPDARPVEVLRQELGLPLGRVLFLVLFDLASGAERKNPWAALAAHGAAFPRPSPRGPVLVVKVHGEAREPEAHARLRAAAAERSDVLLLEGTWSRSRLRSLQQACDALVSLHRAEGFGLAPAECMALGRPVVSTDWSATAEFIDGGNGCPVQARLVALDRAVGVYPGGTHWAEPDLDHAAWHLRRLAADEGRRDRLGRAAAATVRERFAPAAIGRLYRRRLDALGRT